jgi:hypothetical protein
MELWRGTGLFHLCAGLLYHDFPTKRGLYVAGLREIADELVAAMRARAGRSLTTANTC